MTDEVPAEPPPREQLEGHVKQAERRRRPLVFVALAALISFWPGTNIVHGPNETLWQCPSSAYHDFRTPDDLHFLGYAPTGDTINAAEVYDLPDTAISSAIDTCRALGRDHMGQAFIALGIAALYGTRRYWILTRARKALWASYRQPEN